MIWKVEVPSYAKEFLFDEGVAGLSHKNGIWSRHIFVNWDKAMFDWDGEDLLHILPICPFATTLWSCCNFTAAMSQI